MHYQPTLQRIRRRPVPPAAVTVFGGGGVGLDLSAVFHQLEMRELLRDTGVRGKV